MRKKEGGERNIFLKLGKFRLCSKVDVEHIDQGHKTWTKVIWILGNRFILLDHSGVKSLDLKKLQKAI